MFIVYYLIIGIVVWTIITAVKWMRSGREYFRVYAPIWNIFTCVIATALLWPFVVGCYALGYALILFSVLREKRL